MHTVQNWQRKSHHFSHDTMFARNDRASAGNIEQVLLDVVDHRICSVFEQRRDDFLDLVTVLFGGLVLSLLNLLQKMKIAFHTRSLQFLVLGVGGYSAKGTLDHDILHDGADLPAM